MSRRYTGNPMSLFDASPSRVTGGYNNQSLYQDYSSENPETQQYVFQPTLQKNYFDMQMQQYKNNPSLFSEEQIADLEQHSQHYGVEFFRNPEDEDFKMGEIIKQAGAGWISGFTTLEIGEQPGNKWERIARNVGHLGGFVGFVPGAAQGARALASAGMAGSSVLMGLAKLKGKSVPMLISGAATKKVSKLASGMRSKALKGHGNAKDAASTFLNNKIANDMFEGAFHLGTASAVSSWTHGVDAMVSSAIHGAAFGAVFKSIGNILKSGKTGDAALGENLIGGMAGALFQGMPSTLRGDTTPEQISEYLMGAYFGFQEGPYHIKTGQKYKAELMNDIVGKKMPAELVQEKIAKDLLERNWDSKERGEVRKLEPDMVNRANTMSMFYEVIKQDPGLMKKLEGVELARTKKGEIQAEPDVVRPEETRSVEEIKKLEEQRKPTDLDPEAVEDPGTIIEYDGISSVIKSNAEKTLVKSWKVDGVQDLFLKKTNIDKLQKHLDKMVKKKDMNVDNVSKFIKKNFKHDITNKMTAENERAFYRNYLKRRISTKPIKVASPVITLKYDSSLSNSGVWYKNFNKIEGVNIDNLSPEVPVNRANNSKAVDAPVLYIEQVYAKEMANRGKVIDLESHEGRPIERVDHFIGRDKNVNLPKEFKLSKLKEIISGDLLRSYEGKRKAKLKGFENLSNDAITKRVDRETRAHLNQFNAEMTKHYEKKKMHYLSGRGDGDLAYYIKYHPAIVNKKSKDVSNDYNKSLNMLIEAGVPSVKRVMKKEMAEYVDAYSKHLGGKKKTEDIFKKIYTSNVMWEMSNNGYEASKTFSKYLETGKTTPNFTKNTINNFIGNSIAFNKRQQIWLTNGVPVDAKAVIEYMKEFGINDLSVNKDGKVVAKAIITIPGKKSTDKPWKQKATDMAESNDGDTTTRRDFLDALNYDAGHPLESGVSKNFIVSPNSKDGGLLAKHMMFDAGTIQSKAMEEGKFHFLLPESSAKQFGTREAYVTKLNKKGKYEFFDKDGNKVDKPEMYEVPIEDLKTVLSEKTSSHNIEDARIPKQLATNLLTNMYYGKNANKVTKEVIDDWYNDYHLKKFHGSEEGNLVMDAFKREPSNQNLEKVIENLENINTASVLEMLTTPGYELYAAKVYDKIARINRLSNESLRQEGESSNGEAQEIVREADQFKGAIDRILNLSKDGDLGVYLHKMTDPYRQQLVRNYVVNSLTRPRMESGMTARMMGYDLELQQRFPELQNNKELYYLGDSMGKKNIRNIVRRKDGLLDKLREEGINSGLMNKFKNADNLSKLWEIVDPRLITSKNVPKEAKKIVENFFEGLNVRIPMDSASGAHSLKFGGFTGRKGYTVLVHPESMRALGGADSDGDKAFIFFDMKSKYKDAYRNSRNEFVKYAPKSDYKNKNPYKNKIGKEAYEALSKEGKEEYYSFVTDNKQEFRKIFTKESEYATPELARKEVDKFKHKARMYSPMLRQTIAENAAAGRANLGPAVVGRQVMGATHAALESIKEHKYNLGPKGKEIEYIMKAKTKPEQLERARELARASIAFPSDPLDEIGLIHKDKAFAEVFNGFFELTTFNRKKNKYVPVTDPKIMRKGFNSVFSDINSALFGKDATTNRAWDYTELKDKLDIGNRIPSENRNSVLAKLAETIHPLNWQDNLASRVNYKAVSEALSKQQALNSDNMFKMANELERAGFSFKMQEPIKLLLEGKLNEGSPEFKEANEFLSNELNHLVAFQKGAPYWYESMKTDGQFKNVKNKKGDYVAKNSELREIGQFVRDIMNEAYRMDVDANSPYKTKVKIAGIEQWYSATQLNQLKAQIKAGKGPKKVEIMEETAKFEDDVIPMGQRQDVLDAKIVEFKEGLTKNGETALDWLLISGTRVNKEGDYNKWKAMNRGSKKNNPKFLEKSHPVRNKTLHEMYGTTQNRFAMQSSAVSETVIKQHWNAFSKLFEQVRVEPPEAVGKDIDNAVEFAKGNDAVINKEKAALEVDGLNKDAAKADLSEQENFMKNYREKLNDLEGFKKISEMKDLPKLEGETLKLKDRLLAALEKNSNKIGGDLELFIRGTFNKTPDQMTLVDAKALVNMLERPGTWFQETRAKFHKNVKTGKNDAPILTKWIHMMFPRSIERSWLSKEMKLVEAAVPTWVKNEKGDWSMTFAKGKKPQHAMGEIQWGVSELQRLNTDAQALEEKKIMGAEKAKENLSWLTSVKDADRLHELAIYQLEKNNGKGFYLKGDHGAAKAYEYDGKTGLLNKKIQNEITAFESKKYNTLLDGGKSPRMATGKEIMGRIQLFWRAKNKEYYNTYVKGKKEHIDRYFTKDSEGREIANVEDFIRDTKRAIQSGRLPHEVIQIGVDNMNRMANHVMIRNTKNPDFKRQLSKRFEFMDTRETKDYWHHTEFDQAELTKALKTAIKTIKDNPARNKKGREQQVSKAAQLAFQLRNITGNWETGAFENWGMYDALKVEVNSRLKKKESLQGLEAPMKAAAQNSRQLHVKGWDRTSNAGIKYGKSLLDTYYNNMTQILGRESIRTFEENQIKKYKKDGKIIDKDGWDNAKAWKNWFEMYLNEAMGFPTIIPDYYLNNKNMNLKGTPYHWFADSTVKNRINKISDMLGIKKNTLLEKEVGQYMDYSKIRSWTNLEAKFQLSTLLAHPKTAIANVFGGSTLTIQSAGFRHWKNARNFKFLRDTIDPTWTNKSDAGKWVESLGIVEQFLTYEAGLSPYTKDLKVKKAYDKLIDVIKKNPEVSDVTLKQIWRESGIGSNVFDKAAWFMRKSERMLRRDSFLAHYLQARDIFGEAITGKGARDHPFLIEWARKGVQDTQFLYTAAFRPAFARSALGKVMTRFQLWAWNSVSFRNKVLREAKIYGFEEGTPQFERFKRTASIDLMVFGLASAFTYSLFEANLPAPYNWIQDTADWLFGDEKTRDRAFFGAYPSALAPLQAVTPPAARLVGPTMKAMIDGDWDKMSNYYIWTMFPFGRLARDVKNSVQNPIRTVENLTGVPYINTHRYLKDTRKIGEEDGQEEPVPTTE